MAIRTTCVALLGVLLATAAAVTPAPAAEPPATQATEADWRAIARLPNFSGVWTPNVTDQNRQIVTNPTPWTPKAAAHIARLEAEQKAGRPFLVLNGCLPHGMPSWMLITHNAMEILLTPGRVTMLGEADGNRMRRIYTDGRPHPEDPDLTFHGHSIGHWEGDTLVVDTVGVLPTSYVALSEAVGVPNNGDMHIVERFHLVDANTLHDDMVITAPKVMSAPWKTTRIFHRQRGPQYDIVEGVCQEGAFRQTTDDEGNAVYVPRPQSADGAVMPAQP